MPMPPVGQMPVPVLGQAPAAHADADPAGRHGSGRANSQQLLSADIAARIAHEDRVQAKAALLPTATWLNGFIYTQPNGPDNSIIFVTNDGPHVSTPTGQRARRVWSPGEARRLSDVDRRRSRSRAPRWKSPPAA